jgi:quercetin dioxygenase-like cupin family protein
MTDAATLIDDLSGLVPPVSPDSIVSRTFLTSGGFKAILFGFASGQELSEHTAAVPAVLHFLRGRAAITLGEKTGTARPGTWAHLPAHMPHSIRAEEEVVMLLLLLG